MVATPELGLMSARGWKRSRQPARQDPVEPLTIPSGLVLLEGVLGKMEDFSPVPSRAAPMVLLAQQAMCWVRSRGTSQHPAVRALQPRRPGEAVPPRPEAQSLEQDCSGTQLTHGTHPALSGDTLL